MNAIAAVDVSSIQMKNGVAIVERQVVLEHEIVAIVGNTVLIQGRKMDAKTGEILAEINTALEPGGKLNANGFWEKVVYQQ